jgi:hypothetical protein
MGPIAASKAPITPTRRSLMIDPDRAALALTDMSTALGKQEQLVKRGSFEPAVAVAATTTYIVTINKAARRP